MDHALHSAATRDVSSDSNSAATVLVYGFSNSFRIFAAPVIYSDCRPASASAKTVALPMPRDPPVTKATRFLKLDMLNSSIWPRWYLHHSNQ
jgi:hypothetical protein